MRFFIGFLFFSLVGMAQTELQKAEQLLVDEEFSKAEILLNSYVVNNPENITGIELLGDAYGHQKKWDKAIKNYKKLVELNPKTANYHYKYGGALGMKALSVNKLKALTLIDHVKQAFITAANLDPKHIETRWALVQLYMQMPGIIGGSKSKSLQYANELERLSKVDGYLAKGYIHEYAKELKIAEKYYKLAVAEGGSLICYEKLTNLYETQQQHEMAISNMEAAQSKHNTNDLNYQIGKMAAENNIQLDKGEKYLRLYITNYSSQDDVFPAWANYRLAQIYKHQNNKKDALKHIDLAISELPNTALFKKEKVAILSLQ